MGSHNTPRGRSRPAKMSQLDSDAVGEARGRTPRLSPTDPPPPVVCVMGQTGAGKSKLAVELALALGGEVVNCDAMQVYRGLPIATAQMSDEERRGVPHHMLGVVDPIAGARGEPGAGGDAVGGGAITVRDFRDAALPVVEEIRARGKVPFLVGGSDYYLQALVSRSLLDETDPADQDEDDNEDDKDDDLDKSAKRTRVARTAPDAAPPHDHSSAAEAHARLRAVDPASAAKIHPNNVRRVRRYLEIHDATGEPPSVVFARRRAATAASSRRDGGRHDSARYRALFLVLRAENDELDNALRRRVDGMVEAGLVGELERLAAAMTRMKTKAGAGVANEDEDDARGVRQSIGFHEWGAYLRARGFAWGGEVGESSRGADAGADLDALRADAVEAMKADTCRLARRQLRRCLRLERRFGWRLTYLDSTTTHAGIRVGDAAAAAAAWARDVYEPALNAATRFLAGEEASGDGEGHDDDDDDVEWVEYRCEACDRTLRGEAERRAHFEGRKHRRRAAAMRKRARAAGGRGVGGAGE